MAPTPTWKIWIAMAIIVPPLFLVVVSAISLAIEHVSQHERIGR